MQEVHQEGIRLLRGESNQIRRLRRDKRKAQKLHTPPSRNRRGGPSTHQNYLPRAKVAERGKEAEQAEDSRNNHAAKVQSPMGPRKVHT